MDLDQLVSKKPTPAERARYEQACKTLKKAVRMKNDGFLKKAIEDWDRAAEPLGLADYTLKP